MLRNGLQDTFESGSSLVPAFHLGQTVLLSLILIPQSGVRQLPVSRAQTATSVLIPRSNILSLMLLFVATGLMAPGRNPVVKRRQATLLASKREEQAIGLLDGLLDDQFTPGFYLRRVKGELK